MDIYGVPVFQTGSIHAQCDGGSLGDQSRVQRLRFSPILREGFGFLGCAFSSPPIGEALADCAK